MKKLLAWALATAMMWSMGMVSQAFDYQYEGPGGKKDMKNYESFFQVSESHDLLTPGQTYYFPCTWSDGPITDEFFEFYDVSVSVASTWDKKDHKLDGYVSNSSAQSRVEDAKFVKGNDGKYYFMFRAKASYSYTEDLPILIAVFAKDKKDPYYRGMYELSLDIGYGINNNSTPERVSTGTYDVDRMLPVLEFDEDMTVCRLNFDDGSYYHANFISKARKFNFLYTDAVNATVVGANPGAKLKFLSFPTRPTMGKDGVLKVYAPGARYLYEIGTDNTLTRVCEGNNEGYLGLTTPQLRTYVASDVELKSAGSSAPSGSTGSGGSTGEMMGLSAIIRNNFSNPFVTLSYGDKYEKMPADVWLKASTQAENLNAKTLIVYAYDEVNNRLMYQSNAKPYIGTDGALYFRVGVKGQYVITDSALTAK